jgi:hypothetical protein
MDAAFFDEWIKPNLHFIEHKPPMPQTDLHHSLKDFDIGLALEVDAADLNRGLALTNKIFVYAQAGLYILATDTKAQTQFIDKNNCLGEICKQQTEDFVIQIGSIISDIQIIRDHKANRFEYAQRFSWEEESQKLPHVWWGIVH